MGFVFSSRRRHTRLQGDWSSDVCSSDLLRMAFTNGKIRTGKSLDCKGSNQSYINRTAAVRNKSSRDFVPPWRVFARARSEERRVGKEGRGGGQRCGWERKQRRRRQRGER